MSVTISGGNVGITVETDPNALKLTGGTLSGELELPQIGNLLNANLVINSYNDTGAGTNYNHTFTPFDGKFNLAPNGGGLTFPNGTTQTTAGLPLTGGTMSGKVNLPASTLSSAFINFGGGGIKPTNPVLGDVWFGNYSLQHTDVDGNHHVVITNRTSTTFIVPQAIDSPSNATAPALRITQRGSGASFLVEDSVSPDTSSFVITTVGTVGIGVAVDSAVSQKLEVVGNVKADGFLSGNGPVFKFNSVTTHINGANTHDIYMSVNGSTYRIPAIFVSTP